MPGFALGLVAGLGGQAHLLQLGHEDFGAVIDVGAALMNHRDLVAADDGAGREHGRLQVCRILEGFQLAAIDHCNAVIGGGDLGDAVCREGQDANRVRVVNQGHRNLSPAPIQGLGG